MTSDSSELDMVVDKEEEDAESPGEVQAPTTSKKRTRGGDSSGDQSLRRPTKKLEYPGLPPESENNSVLKFFSEKAIDKVTEYGTAIFDDIVGQREDPQFYSYLSRRLEETGYATTDLTKEFERGKVPRHKKRDHSSLKLKNKKKAVSISEASVAETLTGFYKEELGEPKNTRTGFFGETGTIESGTQNFTEIMDVDLISLFSQTIITYLKESQEAITEIQAMVLPDRIFVSANEAGALARLVGKKIDDVLKVARSYQKTAKGAFKLTKATKEKIPVVDDERDARAQVVRDLTGVFAGTEPSPEMVKYLTTILVSALYSPEQAGAIVALLSTFSPQKVFVDARSASTAEALAPFITGSANAGKLIIIGSGDNCHAEQNLLIAIARSGYTGSATIAGGKRPCQTCACAFILVNECKNDNIVWYERPGGAWGGSTRKSFATLASLLKIELADVKKIAKKLLIDDGQFATSFDPETPDRVMATGFGKEVTVKKKKGEETSYADRIPRPRRLPSELFTGVEEYEPPTLSSQDSLLSLDSQPEISDDEVAGLKEDQEKQNIDEIRANLAKLPDDDEVMGDGDTDKDDTDKEDNEE